LNFLFAKNHLQSIQKDLTCTASTF
jgi:hypothetical protein